MSATGLDRLAKAFREHTLPKVEWTHHAHLRVGLWHLLRYPEGDALDRLRDDISRYNVAVGVPNTDTGGYHETITRFYVLVIARFVASADGTRPADDLADDLVREWGDKELPLRHWSRDRLFSPEARRTWLEPDLEPVG